MPLVVEINQQALPTRKRFSESWLTNVVLAAARGFRKQNGRISLAFVTAPEMKRINYFFLKKNKPTDVLAFSMDESGTPEKGSYLGEVIVCPAVALRQAPLYHTSYREEIARLVVHGVLHLGGYNHTKKQNAKKMFSLTDRILSKTV